MNYQSSYKNLLQKCCVPVTRISTSRNLTIEVYKCVNKSNPANLNEMFNVENVHTTYMMILLSKDKFGAKVF